jgi:NTE family protein
LDTTVTINDWIKRHGDSHPPLNKRKIIDIRTIKMTRDTAWSLKHTSKFDRSPRHFAALREEGEMIAERWLADWRAQGKDFGCYPADARYPEPIKA